MLWSITGPQWRGRSFLHLCFESSGQSKNAARCGLCWHELVVHTFILEQCYLVSAWYHCDTIESHNTPRGSGIDQDAGPSFWLGNLDDGLVSTAVYIQGCFATGGTIQGVAYGMMSFHGGYNEWHILLPCEVAQYDWYHRHMLNYVFGTGGMTMSDIAISSWCSTERQGDTSESVVFHFLLLGVWDRCLFVCVWLLCFVCFVCWFP